MFRTASNLINQKPKSQDRPSRYHTADPIQHGDFILHLFHLTSKQNHYKPMMLHYRNNKTNLHCVACGTTVLAELLTQCCLKILPN